MPWTLLRLWQSYENLELSRAKSLTLAPEHKTSGNSGFPDQCRYTPRQLLTAPEISKVAIDLWVYG